MERNDLVRLRWRLTGAWQWPSFIVLTWVDGVVINLLPPQGDSEGLFGAWVIALVLNLIALCVIGPPLSVIIRRARDGMPWTIARNYAGTVAVVAVAVAFLIAGIVHHPAVDTDSNAMVDASQRAEAWMGDHAPARFLANIHRIDTIALQAPTLYRSCVLDTSGTETYCVVVNRSAPFGQGVRADGYTSNELYNQGAN